MVKISVIVVGKAKGKWIEWGIAHYRKLLKKYVKLSIQFIAEEKVTRNKNKIQILELEGRKILSTLDEKSFFIVLDRLGQQKSSEELAGFLQREMVSGKSSFTFIIGGVLGLSPVIKQKASLLLSLSPLTFPHQLTWLLVLEQIYRVFGILHHTGYHK